MVPTSPARAVRFAIGAGLLSVANDLVVFVSPAGAVADEWSDLAQAPARGTEIQAALRSEPPADHHFALLHLVDGGAALLSIPGQEPVKGSIQPSVHGVIRFGMRPGPVDGYWIGAGTVGASGFELTGFTIEEVAQAAPPGAPVPESKPTETPVGADPPPPRSAFFPDGSSREPPPPQVSGGDPVLPVHSSGGPQPPADRPVLTSAPFSDLPIESDPPAAYGPSLSIRFDDGTEIPLDQQLAVGRAPEDSAEVGDGTAIVVVSGDQVSRCHLTIRPCDGGAEVIDTNSLNGCFLDDADRPGGGPQIPVG
ncbi:MAG: FHA domain-containing protein, partial [Acidimicrobiia bacterium]|nr:FHA domain-containing protein [Acidimicrobiia bacterium]